MFERFTDLVRTVMAMANQEASRYNHEFIGPVDVDYGDDNRCEPLDVLKHLASDTIKQKLGT